MSESSTPMGSSSARNFEHFLMWSLGITILLMFPVSRIASKGLAPLLVLFALIGLGYWLIKRSRVSVTRIGACAALFVALALASTLWSHTPAVTLKTAVSLVGTLLCGYAAFYLAINLSDDSRLIIKRIFVYGSLVALAILAIDLIPQEIDEHFYRDRAVYNGADSSFWNVRKVALTIAALIIWPWLAAARDILPRLAIIGVVTAYAIIIGASGADAVRSAMILGLIAATAVYFFRRTVLVTSVFGLILLIAAIPLIPPMLTDPLTPEARYENLSESAIHRIAIWQRAAEKIKDHPVVGLGFDTARSLYGSSSVRSQKFLPGTDRHWTIWSEPIPLHPHNAFLQIWIELGAIGALFAAIFLCALINIIGRKSRDDTACAIGFGLFVGGLFIANISFGAWQAWWLSSLTLVGALTVLALTPSTRDTKSVERP